MKPSPKVLLAGAVLAAVAVVGACSSSLSDLVGVSAHNVYITPGSPQPAAGGDSVYFSISNSGVAPAYLARCGDAPALDFQVYTNGAWVEQGPAVACPEPSSPGPIELDPGSPIVLAFLYANPGRYRVGISTATKADLSDADMAWTIPFDITP